MMTCSRNLSKHLKNCCQTKTNMKMFQHSFQYFANLVTFFSQKKVMKFLFHICAKFQTKIFLFLIMACVFECFLSHCQILKELHDLFCMMGAITSFGKNSFIFNFVDYGLVTKSFGARCTFEEVAKKTECQKMNVNLLQLH
jgi:hypothetical protein